MRDTIVLALVDDHQIVIDGLMSLLRGHDRFHIAFATTDPREVITKMKATPIDILLTDILMPNLPGNELAKQVKKVFPGVKILALSMSGQGDMIHDMISESDISGYVLKNVGKQELAQAIEKIAAGEVYFSEEVLDELKRTNERRKKTPEVHLTGREIEIIRLIEKE